MARRDRMVYRWEGHPGAEHLQPNGRISEAALRAWEYQQEPAMWDFDSGDFHDTVRRWKTARPDLRRPAELFVGDYEEVAAR